MNVTTVAEYANATTTTAVSVEKIAHKLVGAPVWMRMYTYNLLKKSFFAKQDADVRVCKRGCGRLYLDWYDEYVCPACGYHEYKDCYDRGI